jgi:hypothetical protein
MMGGDCGASNWGQTVYGAAGSQQPVSATDHRIAMNNPGASLVKTTGGGLAPLAPSELGGAPVVALVKGGDGEVTAVPMEVKPEASLSAPVPPTTPMVGGGIITDVAVPAVLLYARDSIRKRKLMGLPSMSMKRSRGHRRSRRGSRRGRGRR